MAISLTTVTKTSFGNVAGNTDMYTGANVDSLFTDLITQIEAKLTSAMHYKGTLANYAAIQAVTTKEVGDVYNATDTGKNYAWDGEAWDELTGIVDLSAYKTDADNEKKYLQLKAAGTAATAGDLALLDTVDTAQIDDSAVTTAKINDAAVTTAKINDGAVTTAKIDSKAVTSAKLSDEVNSDIADGLAGAPVFSASTAYSQGDIVRKGGKLYRFTAAHSAGAWSGSDAEEITFKGMTAQADWNQTTSTAFDYIKNKPTLGDLAAKSIVSYSDLNDASGEVKGKVDNGVTAYTNVGYIAAVSDPDAMPTKASVTLYGLYDEVASIRTAVVAIIDAAGGTNPAASSGS